MSIFFIKNSKITQFYIKKKTLNKNPFISTSTCNQLNTVKLELTTEKTG